MTKEAAPASCRTDTQQRRRGHDRRASRPRSRRHQSACGIHDWLILSRRDFVTAQPQKRPRSSWTRFEAAQPNQCWQADVTHWHLADGAESSTSSTTTPAWPSPVSTPTTESAPTASTTPAASRCASPESPTQRRSQGLARRPHQMSSAGAGRSSTVVHSLPPVGPLDLRRGGTAPIRVDQRRGRWRSTEP